MNGFRGRMAFRSRRRHLFCRRANAPAPRNKHAACPRRVDWLMIPFTGRSMLLVTSPDIDEPLNTEARRHSSCRNGSNYHSSFSWLFPLVADLSSFTHFCILTMDKLFCSFTSQSYLRTFLSLNRQGSSTFIYTVLWFNFAHVRAR